MQKQIPAQRPHPPALRSGRRSRLTLLALGAALLILSGLALVAFAPARSTVFAQQMPDGVPSIVGTKPLWSLSGATGWLNTPPLKAKELKGKVVLIDFWTYSCINCLRSMPYIEAWSKKYKNAGLVVIGVDTPEFGFEHKLDHVKLAIQKYGLTFPVALDANYSIWNAFHNEFWPADYLIGPDGRVRYEHFGEGNYAEFEGLIQTLLRERDQSSKNHANRSSRAAAVPAGVVSVLGHGAEAPGDFAQLDSPETYIGYARAARFVSPGGLRQDAKHSYSLPASLALNQWGLGGTWTDHPQVAVLDSPTGEIAFHFHARDLNLVLGPTQDGKPVRFRITIGGHAPGADHGVDVDAQGNGVVREYRLYQLVRQRDGVHDQTFRIEFLEPGVQAFSFTFG